LKDFSFYFKGNQIMATVTTPTKIGIEFLVKGGLGDQTHPEMAALKDGSFVMTWVVDNGIVGQHYKADGSKTGLEFMISKSASGQNMQKVVALEDGGFVVVWNVANGNMSDEKYILAQRFDNSFSKIGDSFFVSQKTANVGNSLNSDNIALTALKNGGFLVEWSDYLASGYPYRNGIKVKIYDGNINSKSQNDEFILSQDRFRFGTPQSSTSITLENGNVVINYNNLVQIYDDKGKPIGDSFSMNTFSGGIGMPTMASLKDGGFITAWYQNNQDGDKTGIFAQRFDSKGNTVGTEFQVNTYTKDNQDTPKVVALPDGGFLITWQSWAQESDPQAKGQKGYGIFAQRYSSDNLPVGSEFQINTTTNDNQDTPNIIALANGSVIAAWQSDNQNGAKDYDIYAQKLSVSDNSSTTTDINNNSNAVTTSTSFNGTIQNDTLQGDNDNNTLLGLAGNDSLNGGRGNDILKGGAGNDTLIGGLDADVLIGGSGADIFKFTSIDELGNTEETADVIVDFNTKQKDKIDLSGIDADENQAGDQVLKFVKKFGADATGQLVFDAKTQMIYGSTNADTDPEFIIQVSGVTSLKAADFIL
jgi:Ca2+-binding RTX toxin-like protein